jgi:predicted nucleic acid-binding protein
VLTYCDSSALVVLLRPDERQREPLVTSALVEASDVTAIEWVTPLEVSAAIHRSLPARQRRAAETRWWEIWSRVVPVAVDASLYELALEAVGRHGLRSLDALHLAAARRIGAARIVSFDVELGKAGRRDGIEVVGA